MCCGMRRLPGRQRDLYADADPELIANFAEPFTNKNGYPIDPDAVMHVISMIVQNDPLAKAIDLLEERCPSWNIHRHKGALLHISSSFRSPFLPAAEALDEVLGIDSVTVWATGRSGDWAVAAREGGTLIRVDKQGHRTTWWHYRLNNLVSATRIAHDQELAIRVRILAWPTKPRIPRGREGARFGGIRTLPTSLHAPAHTWIADSLAAELQGRFATAAGLACRSGCCPRRGGGGAESCPE